MPTPLDIEHRFQDLKHALSFPASPRQRLLAIGRFLTALDTSAVPKESYLIELAEYLPNIIAKVDLDGCDPEDVRSLYKQLRVFESYGVDTNPIRLAAVLLFAYAGEIGKAVALLGNETPSEALQNELPKKETDVRVSPANGGKPCSVPPRFDGVYPAGSGTQRDDDDLTPFARLQKAIEECKDERMASELKSIAERWSANITPQVNSITVPVVEHPFVKSPADEYESCLRRIRIEVLGESSSAKDEIHADVSVFGAETNAAEIVAAPITAARNLINEKHSDIAKRFVAGHLLFEGDHALHEGCSANLGIALLAYCAILRSTLQREQYRILPTVAVSGAIDDKGNVQPVEAATLPNKVKGAFFSWVEFLIVPKQQLAIAEEALRTPACRNALWRAGSLAEKYPHRTLTLIGVANMREVFFDRRLAELIRVPLPKHVVRKVWKWRMPIAIGVIGLLLGLIWRLWYGPLDRNPVGYKFEGEMLYITNKDNQVVEKLKVGKRTVNDASWTGFFENKSRRLVSFSDIDKDGVNEIFWVQFIRDSAEDFMTVNCKSIGEKKFRWTVPLQRGLNFPHSTDVNSKNFVATQIITDDLDGDGNLEVIVNAWNYPFFPGLVLRLDAASGKELGHYINIGTFSDMKTVDLDGDGVKEILLCGGNNAFLNACVTILDPRFISGHSPLTHDYVVEGYGPGTEIAYIRFPTTVVGRAFRRKSKGNFAWSLNVNDANKVFFVGIQDLSIKAPTNEEWSSALLVGYFRFDLSVKAFATADDFDLTYRYLSEEGRIPPIPRSDYMKAYQKTIQYWDGDAWENKLVLNKNYLNALKERGLPLPKLFINQEFK